MLEGLGKFSDEVKLKICHLTTLEMRRNSGDLIKAFKMLSGGKAFASVVFRNKEMLLRGDEFYRKSMGNTKKNYFNTRVVSLSNKLAKDAIHADAVDTFKINLSKCGYWKLRVRVVIADLGLLNHCNKLLCYVMLCYVKLSMNKLRFLSW